MDYVLGLDTSNYTTSVAALGLDGERLADVRQLLPVATGQRGLRQSDALFFHVQHLPQSFAELRRRLPQAARLCAIGASVHPRPQSRSYMPVFRAAASDAIRIPTAVKGLETRFSGPCSAALRAPRCETTGNRCAVAFSTVRRTAVCIG